MTPDIPDATRLKEFLRRQSNAERVELRAPPRARAGWCDLDVELHGGKLPGPQRLEFVGERDGPLSAAQEFAVRSVAFKAGVATSEPLWLDEAGEALGSPGFFVRPVAGDADTASTLLELEEAAGDAIVFGVGQALAKLHSVAATAPGVELAFLPVPGKNWAETRAAAMRERLDDLGAAEPVFEWAVSWMLDRAPPIEIPVLVHGDLRAAQLRIDGGMLGAIDGFGAAHWSDAMEDLGRFCARFWRGKAYAREAGGIGSRQSLYKGYTNPPSASPVDESRVAFWEIVATLNAGIEALCGGDIGSRAETGWMPTEFRRLRAIEAQYDLLMDISAFKERGA
jgi:aminoglycoside phosphotransferase (APT) family kinase protein